MKPQETWLLVMALALAFVTAFGFVSLAGSGCKSGVYIDPVTGDEVEGHWYWDGATKTWKPLTQDVIDDTAGKVSAAAATVATVAGQSEIVPIIDGVAKAVAVLMGAWAIQTYRKKNGTDKTKTPPASTG